MLWLSSFSALAALSRDSARITLAFFDAPLVNVLQALADNRHLNLIVSEEVKGNTSVKLVDVPWPRALQAIARMNQLSIEQTGNILFVQTAEASIDSKSWRIKTAARERSGENVRLHCIAAGGCGRRGQKPDAAKSGLLSAQGSISADPRTNTILVRDFPENTRAAQAWIEELDQPVSQVQLTAHIVTINRESLNELGIRWGTSESDDGAASDSSGFRLNQFNMGLPVEGRAFNAGFKLRVSVVAY